MGKNGPYGLLKARFVETLMEDGDYCDGGGLYLQVRDGGRNKSWKFRYSVPEIIDGIKKYRDHQMGLGSASTVRLGNARERARICREQRLDGIDPLAARKKRKDDQKLAAKKQRTFQECFEEWCQMA